MLFYTQHKVFVFHSTLHIQVLWELVVFLISLFAQLADSSLQLIYIEQFNALGANFQIPFRNLHQRFDHSVVVVVVFPIQALDQLKPSSVSQLGGVSGRRIFSSAEL